MSTGFVFRALSFVVLLLLLGWTSTANAATPTTISVHAMQNLEDADCDGIPDFLDPEITLGGCDESESGPPAAEEPESDEQPIVEPEDEAPVVEEPPAVNPQPASHQVTTLPNTGTGAAQSASLVPAGLMTLLLAAIMVRSATRMP